MEILQYERLRTPEAARYLHVSVSYLTKLRVFGGGPKFAKLSRSVVYDRQELDAWVSAHTCDNTASGIHSAPVRAALPNRAV